MTPVERPPAGTEGIATELLRLAPDYAPTPLHDLPRLAARLGVAQVLAKDEGRRMLGSFKSLGGTYAARRALARAAGENIDAAMGSGGRDLPALLCASDGNHGLAVALAAKLAGATARVFLHGAVPPARAERIEALGAEIVWVAGTYDDAVAATAEAARAGSGLLVADTTEDPADPVVRDVMAGYGVMAAEIRQQVEDAGHAVPTHLFVQAGVGGLAAAMARELAGWLASPAVIVIVEPEAARCVGAALEAGRVVQVEGDLRTVAGMLACGRASAPALEVLRAFGVVSLGVDEAALRAAPTAIREAGGPDTTPSGAAGLAGAMVVAADGAPSLRLGPKARLLLVLSEAGLESGA